MMKPQAPIKEVSMQRQNNQMTTTWNTEFYKTGYEGFESPESFPTRKSLQDYHSLLLQKTEKQVAFIARHLGRRNLRVIDFGSGNGRLLVALALEGMLDLGIGVEISQSRVAFAQQWTADLNLSSIVHNIAADALEFANFEHGMFDIATCITGAFGYFKPIRESAPVELLTKMRAAVKSGGHLLMELYQMPEKRKRMLTLNEGKLRTWQPLPDEDRFAYYLDDFEYCEDRRILRHDKIFIGRNGKIDTGRVEVVAFYTDVELVCLLGQNGFYSTQIYEGFEDMPYFEGQSPSMVVLAR
ncbi:class I SAM-dependent methyltransferase [Desulfobacterium sp. N47]|uniref:Methyltransferase domain-containing protein n=1 Tax=uncultured Desulfobacterium sp. TaxID=201089 RepID=E1YGX5_9BACT|nr:hypothetical protein N47_F15140 [uncultured Desulfobacterium sp.]